MSTVLIQNLTRKPIWVPLTTGQRLFVGALETSAPLEELLVRRQAAIEALEQAGVIRRYTASGEAEAPPEVAAAPINPARRSGRQPL